MIRQGDRHSPPARRHPAKSQRGDATLRSRGRSDQGSGHLQNGCRASGLGLALRRDEECLALEWMIGRAQRSRSGEVREVAKHQHRERQRKAYVDRDTPDASAAKCRQCRPRVCGATEIGLQFQGPFQRNFGPFDIPGLEVGDSQVVMSVGILGHLLGARFQMRDGRFRHLLLDVDPPQRIVNPRFARQNLLGRLRQLKRLVQIAVRRYVDIGQIIRGDGCPRIDRQRLSILFFCLRSMPLRRE